MSRSVSPWLMMLLAGIYAITPFAVDTYLPAMPTIADELHTHIGVVQQSLSIFLAAYGIGMLFFGPLADKFGPKPLALFGLAGFATASFLLACTTTIQGFLLARAAQAFCGAAATVVIPSVIRSLYQEQTAKGMSYLSMMMMLAPLIAPSIGSAVLLWGHWNHIFLLIFCYAAVVLFLIAKYFPVLPARLEQPTSVNFIQSYRQVFSERGIFPLILTILFSSFSFFCYLTAVPFLYITYFGVSEQVFSALFAVNIIMLMLANFINSRLVNRYGSARMVLSAFAVALLLATLLCVVNLLHLPIYATVATLAPLIGCLIVISTNTDAMIILKFPHHASTATAVTGTLRYGCGALAGPILALTFTGTAIPFALLMLSGIMGIGCCQWWIRYHRNTFDQLPSNS